MRRSRGHAAGGIVACLGALLAVAPSAAASTTFGANLNRAPDGPYTCGDFGFGSCSWESIELTTGESTFPPVGTGVISRVRVRVGNVTGPMQIVVEEALRRDNPSDPGHPTYACCKAINLSQVFTPAPNAVTTVPVNLPVRQDAAPDPNTGFYVDDHLALSVLAPNVPIPASSDPNASLSGWFPAWQSNQERCCPYGTSGVVILFNADWDPATSAPGTGGGGPGLTLGRLRMLDDGTARLGLRVPGPGVLRLGDAGGAAATAPAFNSKKKHRALVRSLRRTVKKAGKVTLKIRPTKAGKARLRRRGKLTTRVRVTFRPTGAKTVATVTKRVRLRVK